MAEIIGQNAVGRFYSALRRCKDVPTSPTTVLQGIGAAFDVPQSDIEKIYDTFVGLVVLNIESRRIVLESINDNQQRYLSGIDHFRSVWPGLSLNSSWSALHSKIDDPHLDSVFFAADKLSTIQGLSEPLPADPVRTDLLKQITDMRRDVLAAGLSENVATLILKHLDLIQEALESYVIRGPEATEAACERALGALLRSGDIYATDGDKSKIQQFLSFVGKAGDWVSRGQAFVAFGITAAPYLGQIADKATG